MGRVLRTSSPFVRLLGVALAGIACSMPLPAVAAICAASGYAPRDTRRDAVMLEAGRLAADGHLADARALYLFLLTRSRADVEARYGLARVDAWEGCLALAEEGYAEVLSRSPVDADVRAGWIDVLMWQGRWDEAERLVDQGLA